MRKAALLLALVLLALALTGCYDSHEIDDLAYVVAMGIDRGVTDKWRLTLQFATTKKSSGVSSDSGGGEENELGDYTYVSVDAPSFFSGISMLNTSMPRQLNFMHAQIIAFSEEVAKAGLIGEYIAPLTRFREIRRSAHVFVVKGKAIEFIKENQPFIGSLVSKNFQLMVNESKDTGYFPHVTLQEFYTGLKSPDHQAIAILMGVNDFENFKDNGEPWDTKYNTGGDYIAGELPRDGKNKIELFGTALFKGDTMIGTLTGDETRFLLMARGEFVRGTFTIQDPQKLELIVPLDVTLARPPDISVSCDGDKPRITLKVYLDGDFYAIQSNINYESKDLRPTIEETFQKIVAEGIADVIEKCQSWGVDAFRFGDFASRNFLTIDEWEAYGWNERFSQTTAEIDVEFIIRRTGTQIKSSPVDGEEEETNGK